MSVNHVCQNCSQSFAIKPEDFDFYEKIKVPPPTWCPECRLVRRLTFRNERTLFRRTCDKCKKTTVSVYHPSSPYTIYCYDCFYSESWDALEYGVSYDFNKNFFEQFRELMLRVPKLARQVGPTLINSEYVNHCDTSKNCYLMFASVSNEDCMYGNHVSFSKNVIDGYRVFKSEFCYDCIDCENCYNLKFSQQCQDCYDSLFLYNCRGCASCFLCSNLIKKSYCIRNKQVGKEEYQTFLHSLKTVHRDIENIKEEFLLLKERTLQRAIEGFNNSNSVGNYLKNTKNCYHCFDLSEGEDCRFVVYGNKVKDAMDLYAAYPTTELCYESAAIGAPSYHCLFSYLPWQGSDIVYCINVFPGCHNCFGCTQIRNKEYCILNQQYSKAEYEALTPKIIEHMNVNPYTDQKGRLYRYGEFFPPEFSPFAYNETIAQEYFPLTKEEVGELRFLWRDPDVRDYNITKEPEMLPGSVFDVSETILNEIIGCLHKGLCNEQCTTAFKLNPQELKYYKENNLPIPHLCSNCRHYSRLKMRNPLKLYKRICMCVRTEKYQNVSTHFHGNNPCPNEFDTSYAPTRPEVIYCNECYQAEVM